MRREVLFHDDEVKLGTKMLTFYTMCMSIIVNMIYSKKNRIRFTTANTFTSVGFHYLLAELSLSPLGNVDVVIWIGIITLLLSEAHAITTLSMQSSFTTPSTFPEEVGLI